MAAEAVALNVPAEANTSILKPFLVVTSYVSYTRVVLVLYLGRMCYSMCCI